MQLFVVATPIGNLGDLSDRAREVFRAVSLVLAEDTRVTGKLMMHLGVKPTVYRFDENSTDGDIARLVTAMRGRASIALVTDAGTPNISDPAFKLIKASIETFGDEIKIVPIPGPSALTAALSIAHFPVQPFVFLGFPPHKKGREKFFEEVANTESTVVFYESVHRIKSCLELLVSKVRDREMLIARELTKLHEEVLRGSVQDVASKIVPENSKGEFVIVLAPKKYSVK
ncbi:MAG: 16S rRNA (cytidine(1402)-2'-O)-methyltransferase [bacterium]